MKEFVRPVPIHLDPDYLALMADISAPLKAVFGTTNELTPGRSAAPGLGRHGGCLASLLAPGEKAIVRPSTLTSQSSRAAAAARSPARRTSSVWIPGTAAMAPGESRVSGAPA